MGENKGTDQLLPCEFDTTVNLLQQESGLTDASLAYLFNSLQQINGSLIIQVGMALSSVSFSSFLSQLDA